MRGVVLNGGLGNQLFQLAATMDANPKFEIHLIENLGSPRRNSKKIPDIMDFELPEEVNLCQVEFRFPKASDIFKRAINLLMRLSTQNRRLSFLTLLMPFRVLARIVISDREKIIFGEGIGFTAKDTSNGILVGYFQSYKYLSPNVYEKLQEIKPLHESSELQSLIRMAKDVRPIMIHLRLGDYVENESYGIPSEGYYLDGIEKCKARFPHSPIWLFTNDKNMVSEKFSEELKRQIDFYPEISESSSENFELFRYGSAYVIGNSTFSWWGSALRYDTSAPVFYPTPWYQGMPTPLDLIHPDWNPLTANFQVP